jgi:alpha-glucosidase
VDAIHHLFEDETFADNPPNPIWREGMSPAEQLLRTRTVDQAEVHGAVASMRRVTDAYDDNPVLIGEAYLPLERLMAYYGGAGEGFHLPFNFHLMTTPWRPAEHCRPDRGLRVPAARPRLAELGVGNHDRSRLASRVGRSQSRVAAMLLLTLRGTPTLYQGDELGMVDVPIPPDRVRDPLELNMPGLGLGRDPVRTPMPWSGEPYAGFSSTEPWLPLNPDWRDMNVARQIDDPASILSLKSGATYDCGGASLADAWRLPGAHRHRSALCLRARPGEDRIVIALNLGDSLQSFEAPGASSFCPPTLTGRPGPNRSPR